MFEEDEDPENGKLFPEMWFANYCHGKSFGTVVVS
jgi:hypothetical protein